MDERVLPLFLKRKDIPGEDFVSCYDMCSACEDISGRDTMAGAQDIRGLWRIYPKTNEARQTLLMQGIELRGVKLSLYNDNPYSVRTHINRNGVRYSYERPTTKLWISDLPLSVADSEIEIALGKLDLELRSTIKRECARNNNGELTHFLTGRRFVSISIPTNPLDKSLRVAGFWATAYHKEMKNVRVLFCHNCLQEGHRKDTCENEVVCSWCKLPGHKKRDPECQLGWPDLDQADAYSYTPPTDVQENVMDEEIDAAGGAAATAAEPDLNSAPFIGPLPRPNSPPASQSNSTFKAPPKPQRGRSPRKKNKADKEKGQVTLTNSFDILRSRSTSRSRSESLKRTADDSFENQPTNKTARKLDKDSCENSEKVTDKIPT